MTYTEAVALKTLGIEPDTLLCYGNRSPVYRYTKANLRALPDTLLVPSPSEQQIRRSSGGRNNPRPRP